LNDHTPTFFNKGASKKITAINGTHSGDKSFTRFFIDKLFQRASEAGAECEILILAKLNIQRCISCYQCQGEESRRICV
jgi:multimeric flavodoxin WrbA